MRFWNPGKLRSNFADPTQFPAESRNLLLNSLVQFRL